MEKLIFEQMGGTYHQEGDYLLPDLTPPEIAPVGVWSQRRKHYLKAHRNAIYDPFVPYNVPVMSQSPTASFYRPNSRRDKLRVL